jgi:hypothetical protein
VQPLAAAVDAIEQHRMPDRLDSPEIDLPPLLRGVLGVRDGIVGVVAVGVAVDRPRRVAAGGGARLRRRLAEGQILGPQHLDLGEAQDLGVFDLDPAGRAVDEHAHLLRGDPGVGEVLPVDQVGRDGHGEVVQAPAAAVGAVRDHDLAHRRHGLEIDQPPVLAGVVGVGHRAVVVVPVGVAVDGPGCPGGAVGAGLQGRLAEREVDRRADHHFILGRSDQPLGAARPRRERSGSGVSIVGVFDVEIRVGVGVGVDVGVGLFDAICVGGGFVAADEGRESGGDGEQGRIWIRVFMIVVS